MAKHEPSGNAVITMRNVSKKWGDKYGVRDVTMEVPAGKIFGLVGPSGCGKTTSIRLMTGVYTPSAGDLRVLGATPRNFAKRARERIGYMPQLFVLYPTLTVWENLNFVASLYGLNWFRRRKRLQELLEFVELTPARNTLAQNISGGMKRRLELACSLVHNPQLLFADEPTAGVDPVLRGKFWDGFRALNAEGHSLVVTTQYVSEVEYCDLVGVMRGGKLLMVETPEGLRRRAFGGREVIELHVDAEDERNARRILRELPFVDDIERPHNQPRGTLQVYVDDAGARLPEMIQSLGTDTTIDMRNAQEFKPPFDDVFIILMEQAAAEDPESALEEVVNV
ncbi:MAG TPA: ABC transporter ATP-binding protein [Herpetosiphonaceae bacterium]|nr:ABC transporter ATP-binding protein [Herpetosiphonaceae bacterium]